MGNYKYMRLAEQLKKDITLTTFSPGQRIPTEDELAERFSLSRNTVRQAVNLLVNEGYLYKIQGSGTFVSESVSPGFIKRFNSTKSRCVGVVMNQANSYIFPRVLMGISDYLFEHDYSTIMRITFNQIAKEEQVLTELLGSNLAGLIIEPARSAFPRVNFDLYRQIENTLPCVLVHADMPGFSFPSITPADIEGYELLVDHLVQNGHRKIAAILKLDEQTGVKRFQGYASGLKRNGIPLDEKRILWFSQEDLDGLFTDQLASRVLEVIEPCTAVMCFNDDLASRMFAFLDRRGIRVPEDLSIVGFDDSLEGHLQQKLTTVLHPKELLGRAAAKAVLTLLDNPETDVSLCCKAEFIGRASVRNIL